MARKDLGFNKENKPLKVFLRMHSIAYFTPNIPEKDEKGKETGRFISQYDIDIATMEPSARVDAEIKLLKFHTPQMQSTAVDMSIADDKKTLTERLTRLAAGKDISSE